MSQMIFENKVAVVTGAGGVLCSSFAKELASKGAKVALLDLNFEAAETVAEEIRQTGGVAKAYRADVLDRACLDGLAKEIHTDLGKCDILINGAGGNSPRCTTAHEYYEEGDEVTQEIKTFFNLDRKDFDFVFGLNLMGTLLPTQVFAPDMLHRNGCILNVSSMNAFRPLTKIPAYSAAKSAVSNFTQWLAVHFAGCGIRVNAIAPGFFVTKQNQALLFHEDGTPTPRTDKILRATPMGRFGKPEELLGTLNWLCDEKASGFVTGVVVPVDGGFSAYSGV
ncbi:MAG: SDR family oxidoreductase [Clostridia bacterium]|nr:SDR family oxidoreductase [Clostridia bacterium]MBR7151859.1 SDR family oxidoreductase [Clostridia bacterium]